tara:strand:- start:26 stop:187 length:162 start_codon:yes stop_codon:yes gene_type:complete
MQKLYQQLVQQLKQEQDPTQQERIRQRLHYIQVEHGVPSQRKLTPQQRENKAK